MVVHETLNQYLISVKVKRKFINGLRRYESLNKRAMMALGRSPEYHWNQIISKSVHWFSRRSRL